SAGREPHAFRGQAYFVNSSLVVEPPSSMALTLSVSPSLVASTAVKENCLVPVSTLTGVVTLLARESVKTALAPSTLTLYSPAARLTTPTVAGDAEMTSCDFWPAKQRLETNNTLRTRDSFMVLQILLAISSL